MEARLERVVGVYDIEGGLGQRLDLGVDRIDVSIDAVADRRRRLLHGFVRVKAILLLGPRNKKSLNPPREGAQAQNRPTRRRPGLEVHSPHELQQRLRIRAVGLRASQLRAREVLRGARISDHDLDPLRLIECQAQIEVINAGRFHQTRAVAFERDRRRITLRWPAASLVKVPSQTFPVPGSMATTSSLEPTSIPQRRGFFIRAPRW